LRGSAGQPRDPAIIAHGFGFDKLIGAPLGRRSAGEEQSSHASRNIVP
jgi:hypothetical protein